MINRLLRLLIFLLLIYLEGQNCTKDDNQQHRLLLFSTNQSMTSSSSASSTNFSFPPLHASNSTTQPGPNTTSFTWPPIHNNNSTTSKTSQRSTTFTWPPLHTTPDPFVWTQDYITIIVGVSLGGIVFVAIVGYVIIRKFNKNQNDEDKRNLVQ